jgi:hypothetical protein
MISPVGRAWRKAPQVPRHVQADPDQPVFAPVGRRQTACNSCRHISSTRQMVHTNSQSPLQRPLETHTAPLWIHQDGMATL